VAVVTRTTAVLLAGTLAATVGSTFGRTAMARDAGGPDLDAWAKRVVETVAARRIPAADFGERRRWLNVSRPLTLGSDLRGKVVVMDFWCYCCINCIHVLPDLAHLEKTYEGKPFAVVGVHSAKFENERDAENVRQAVVRYEIRHPVVVDDDFGIWNAYGAEGWPHLVVVSPTGHLLWSAGGEGHREELDAIVRAALDHYGKAGATLDAKPLPMRLERTQSPPAELAYPGKLAVDAEAKRLYVSDSNHHRVVETDLDGKFLRAFGDGEAGWQDGPAASARFRRPQGLALRGGWLWVADAENHRLRRIRLTDGAVETAAGTGRQGNARQRAGPALSTDLSTPWDVVFAGDDLYVAMAGTHQVWRLDAAGTIGPFAGDGSERRLDADGPGALARSAFAQPSGLAFDGERLWVADSESSSVRSIRLPAGPVATAVGGDPDPTNLHTFGLADGAGFRARLQHPLGVLARGDVVYVADTYNHAVRALDRRTGALTTPWGTGAPGSSDGKPVTFYEPSGLALAGDRLYVADTNNHRVRTIDLATGAVSTLALKDVPLPQDAARAGGVASRWPDFPGTARTTLPSTAVRAGKPLVLKVALSLPEGWKLTEDAPSTLRVEGLGPTVTVPILGAAVSAPLPEVPEGGATLRIRLLYYACREVGSCRLRSADLSVPLAPSPDGPAEVAVEDTFVP
jgi:DNA-binding beta-propeller fold protein YncE